MKKILLPVVVAVLAGCAAPSSSSPSPSRPVQPASPTLRYDDDREDELDHDLSRSGPVTPVAVLT